MIGVLLQVSVSGLFRIVTRVLVFFDACLEVSACFTNVCFATGTSPLIHDM